MSGRTRGLGGMRGGPQMSGGQRRGALSDAARAQINEAYQALDAEQAQAAEAFGAIAAKLAERGEALVALHLQIRGATEHGRAGQPDEALQAGQKAIAFAVQSQNRPLALRKLAGLVHALRAQGHEAAAEAIETEARATLDAKRLPAVEEAPKINRAMRRNLPKRCPACGVRTDAEQVEIREGGAADCGRCGTSLLG